MDPNAYWPRDPGEPTATSLLDDTDVLLGTRRTGVTRDTRGSRQPDAWSHSALRVNPFSRGADGTLSAFVGQPTDPYTNRPPGDPNTNPYTCGQNINPYHGAPDV